MPSVCSKPIVASITSNTVVLHITVPPEGGSPVRMFTVDCIDMDENMSVLIKQSRNILDQEPVITCRVLNLKPGSAYIFRCYAESLVGSGPFSPWTEEIRLPEEGPNDALAAAAATAAALMENNKSSSNSRSSTPSKSSSVAANLRKSVTLSSSPTTTTSTSSSKNNTTSPTTNTASSSIKATASLSGGANISSPNSTRMASSSYSYSNSTKVASPVIAGALAGMKNSFSAKK